MTELTPNDATLLATMIATVGTVWGIGFVGFAFLFERWKDFLKELHPGSKLPRYSNVFRMFLLATLLSFGSIVLSLAVFAANTRELLPLAWAGFLVSTGTFFSLTLLVYKTGIDEVL